MGKPAQLEERVARLQTHGDCERFAVNATERGRPDLAEQARKRAIALRADNYGVEDSREKECIQAVYAYELVLIQKKGRSMRAVTIWRSIEKFGVLGAIERAVDLQTEIPYHDALIELGLQDHAFESVVTYHPELFSPAAVRRAHRCVAGWRNASQPTPEPPVTVASVQAS